MEQHHVRSRAVEPMVQKWWVDQERIL